MFQNWIKERRIYYECQDQTQNEYGIYKSICSLLSTFSLFYFSAVLMKKFVPGASRLIPTILSYIPIYVYVYFSAKKRGISADNMGLVPKKVYSIALLFLVYIGIFIYEQDFTYNTAYNWVYDLLCTGVLEELLFRGYIYARCKQFTSVKIAVVLNMLFFTFLHVPPQMVLRDYTRLEALSYFFLNLGGMSVVTGILLLIKEKTNNVWIPVFLHAIHNFSRS